VTSDWLCMWWEGALDPAIKYKYRGLSLCRYALLWLGPANGSSGCWISVSARRGLEWHVGPSWIRWSVAFGALSDGSLAHTLGSWEGEVRSRHGGL
jgi:hypothetical protein